MGTRGEDRTGHSRGGYSLLELLLVLAVLTALLGLAWPAMQRTYADLELKQGSEKVRGELVQARLYAIDSGRSYQFRYEPAGRRYVAVPLDPDGPAGGTGAGMASVSVGAPATPPTASKRLAGRLSEGLRFEPASPDGPHGGGSAAIAGMALATEQLSAERFAGLPEPTALAGTKWSAPLVFHADGSSNGGGLVVVDESGQSMRLSIRDLTGAVSVGPVRRRSR